MREAACFAGASEQARRVHQGEISALELISETLRQIEQWNPVVNAYRVVFADAALDEAKTFDARPDRRARSPLGGVPVAIKDDIDVRGEVTAWGTSAHGPAPTADAEVVARLRAAGAIVIGKTHVLEMTAW